MCMSFMTVFQLSLKFKIIFKFFKKNAKLRLFQTKPERICLNSTSALQEILNFFRSKQNDIRWILAKK